MVAIAGMIRILIMIRASMHGFGAITVHHHVLHLHGLRHLMCFSRQQAETTHHNLHSKQHRHQAGHGTKNTTNMQLARQHTANVIPVKIKAQ